MADSSTALSTPPATPPQTNTTAADSTFSVTPHYHALLTSDPTLTPPIAAIESLISLLSSSPMTTVSETLSLIAHASQTLLASQRNPIPVSAGTDLFQRYLVTTFQNAPANSDFTQLRSTLITNSKVFVARAKGARGKIAGHGLPLIREGGTVVTYGGSRVVGSLLARAAEKGRWCRVVQVVSSAAAATAVDGGRSEGGVIGERVTAQVAQLRKAGIKVAVVPLSALSFALQSLSSSSSSSTTESRSGASASASGNVMCVLGTSAVLENGAAVSEMGCYLVSQVARAHSVPLYIATESYKFARQFPVGYGARDLERMGTRQDVLRFTTGGGGGGGDDAEVAQQPENNRTVLGEQQQLVDITPPQLITGLITENGVMTPNAVAEELIKLWF